jgi:NADPH-dependent glutamate synthase beta subunit-like oxidoreductase
MNVNDHPAHVIAIVGGAVSGSVAASILAESGCEVVVFEQNDRPYGKIEDGLPRWHTKLRKQEYKKIDDRLAHERIHFVPRTRLGRDLDFEEIASTWGLSAFLLANGAWRDRPLEVPGVDDYVDKGLVYQNPLIYWFNHKNEKAYSGPRYDVPDGTMCVGGGLASIDVIKVIQLEIYERALRRRGIEATMYELEHEGIARWLQKKGIDPKSLEVTDGMLLYRRRAEDMPLADTPAGATPEQLKKAEFVRKKILEVAQRKFLFRFQERRLSKSALVEGGRLVGLTVLETKVEGRSVQPVPGSEQDLRAPLVISSIGSVPERIRGIGMKGETYTFKNWDTGEYDGHPGVFGLGNVVTGKGNIRESFEHGEFVAKHLVERYLGLDGTRDVSAVTEPAEEAGKAQAAAVMSYVASRAPLAREKASAILERIRERQRVLGYLGYADWIAKNTPPDLE